MSTAYDNEWAQIYALPGGRSIAEQEEADDEADLPPACAHHQYQVRDTGVRVFGDRYRYDIHCPRCQRWFGVCEPNGQKTLALLDACRA